MSAIQIRDLNISGSSLLTDGESYLNEIDDRAVDLGITYGASTVGVLSLLVASAAASAVASYIYGRYYAR